MSEVLDIPVSVSKQDGRLEQSPSSRASALMHCSAHDHRFARGPAPTGRSASQLTQLIHQADRSKRGEQNAEEQVDYVGPPSCTCRFVRDRRIGCRPPRRGRLPPLRYFGALRRSVERGHYTMAHAARGSAGTFRRRLNEYGVLARQRAFWGRRNRSVRLRPRCPPSRCRSLQRFGETASAG
jgi:hypothetical protein